MLLLLLLFGAFMPLPTAALCASAWLKQGSNLKLRLLPFLLEHPMMPGETRNVYLFDDSLQAAVSAAADTHACVGGLLMTGSGEPSELAMLLRVDSVKADCEYCSWARLSCIGRCRVSKVLKNKRHGYRVAVVSPLVDDAGSIAGIEEPVRAVHGRVAAQRRLLRRELIAADAFDSGYWESLGQSPSADIRRSTHANSSSELIFVGADKGRAPFGVYQSYESFEETGVLCDHVYMGLPWERPSALGCCYFNARDLGEIDDEENGAELDELIATRRAVLTTAAAGDNGSSPSDCWTAWAQLGECRARRRRSSSCFRSLRRPPSARPTELALWFSRIRRSASSQRSKDSLSSKNCLPTFSASINRET